MVFFTCSHCGESVKKSSVAKHYQTKCRNYAPFLTCVDCLKDFKENEYEAHTKCVTEDERYSAKGYVPKPSANKGERKQKAWSDCFQGLLSTGDLRPDEKNLLQAIVKYNNIPRKKVKFMNFLNTSLKAFANKVELIDRVWEKMENYFKEINAEKQNPIIKAENNSDECKGTQKRKHEECNEENNEMGEVEERKKNKKKKKNVEGETDNMGNEQEETIEVGSENGEEKKKKKSSKGEMESSGVGSNAVSGLEIVIKEGKKKKRKKQSDAEETNCKKNDLAKESELRAEEKESKKKKKNCNSGTEITEREEPPKKKSKADLTKEGVEGVTGLDNKENVSEKKKSEKAVSGNVPAKGMEGKSEEKNLFNWTDVIVDILTTNGKDNEMTLKKLQKKVLKKYRKVSSCEINEKAIRKFTKKLNKINGVVINGDHVCLNK